MAIGARRVAESEEIVRTIEAQGGEACFVSTDVREPEQIKQLVDTAVGRWGRLDCAFNNAGIAGPAFIPIPEYPLDDWNQVMAVNLTGVFLSMKYEIPAMLASGGGAIVNMSSIAGQVGGQVGAAYYASKHGVIGATKAAALEYSAKGIRVNAVCPAVIRTDMSAPLFGGDAEARVVALHPIGRFGEVEEVAQAVVWLCSPKASFITGASLPVDGGFLAR